MKWGAGAVCHLAAAVMCGAVLIHGIRSTADLDWPADPDHFRDIAQAQTMRDGAWLQDPSYRGESIWYNPLLPSIIAAISYVADEPVHVVGTRAGAYLNLAGPIAFYLLAVRLLGPSGALAALAGLLFVVRAPTWASPSYAPWLFPSVFAQLFFYLTLTAYWSALAVDRGWRFLASGILLGTTFLAHAAPAVLAGVSIAAVTGYRGVAEKVPARKLAAELALIVGPAILVALPFLSSIVGRYHLRIRNPVPLVWQDSAIPAALSQMAWDVMVSRWPVNIVILSGIAAIAWRRNSRRAAIMVLTWLGASVGLFVYNHYFVLDASGQIALPLSVPAHHFLVYGRAGGMLLFGLGVSVIASGAGWMAWRSIRGRFGRARLEPMQHAVSLLLVAAIVWHNYPAFLARDAFGPERDLARSRFTTVELRTVTPWIRANTEPSDVFLTAESACLSIVSTAGRKCVVAPRFFSNPYVDWGARSVAGQAMWDALMADDCAGFRLQAYAYRVTYVMTVETRTPQVPPGRCGLRPTSFPGSSWRIYRAFWN